MSAARLPVAVVMERRVLANRWQSEAWRVADVVPWDGAPGEPRLLRDDGASAQWLWPGFAIELYRDEAEGYYLNLSSGSPVVFVMWRLEEGQGVPKIVTASYHEAGRMLDGGEQVDNVPMPREAAAWLAEFTDAHLKPEPKKRARPPSFKGARREGEG
ncbi:MAG: DUF3305 domain-containing protein [Burkholderiales bacterium]|nr:DUF3305 domain-containing protein [Burkholderiales bacterium]